MNSHEFYNELRQLTELGYLEQAQLERIRNEYIKTRKEGRSIFLILALLGVMLIGAGVISLFAYNWSMFSREMKAFIAFLPLLGVQGILWWKVRANGSDVWIKSLTLALGIAFLSALGLIYQAYQLSFSIHSMLTAGFLLMLPVVYLLDGYYLAVLYMAGVCFVGANSNYTLLVLLLFPYYYGRVKSGENCGLMSLCFFIWFPYLAFLYLPYGAYYACILILLIYTTIEKPALYRRLAGGLLYVMLFLKAVFYMFYYGCSIFLQEGIREWYWPLLPELVMAALLAGAAIRMYILCKKNAKSGRLSLLLSAAISGLLVVDIIIYQWWDVPSYHILYASLVNLCFIAFSLYKLLCGMKLANLPSVRRYTAAIILYIVLKVCLGDYHLLVKGTVFLIAGLAFLAVNYMMALRLKGGNIHEETPE